jgi:hypothetical protein
VPEIAASLAAVTRLDPLCDELGRRYDPTLMPCAIDPERWSEDADESAQLTAAWECRRCPALRACAERARDLGPLATGVWGGMILSSTSEERPYDPRWPY